MGMKGAGVTRLEMLDALKSLGEQRDHAIAAVAALRARQADLVAEARELQHSGFRYQANPLCTWQEIADALGVTRQAIASTYKRGDD